MPPLIDIRELKTLLEIDPSDNSEDSSLLLLVDMSSGLIEDWLNRSLFYKQRTEFYGGTGTQNLCLRARPVYLTDLAVYVDEFGYFGSTSGSFQSSTLLTYGDDYCLDLPEESKPSQNGILVKIKGYWPRPAVRQRGLLTPFIGQSYGNIKVVYWAGYTYDDLPPAFRLACNLLVARIRNILPLGAPIGSESYEERSVSYIIRERNLLLGMIKPLIWRYRNWRL